MTNYEWIITIILIAYIWISQWQISGLCKIIRLIMEEDLNTLKTDWEKIK